MIATEKTVFDGHVYDIGEEIPEFGSIELVEVVNNNQRSYQCLSVDIAKLPTRALYPKYKDLGAGSSCLVLDDSSVMIYHKESDAWLAL